MKKKPFLYRPGMASLFLYHIIQVSHVVQVRAEGPKAPEAARPERAEAPSPGHRPGYDGNQQDAL